MSEDKEGAETAATPVEGERKEAEGGEGQRGKEQQQQQHHYDEIPAESPVVKAEAGDGADRGGMGTDVDSAPVPTGAGPPQKEEITPAKAEGKGGGSNESNGRSKEEEPSDSPSGPGYSAALGTAEEEFLDPKVKEEQALIESHEPRTPLEIALTAQRQRSLEHIDRLTAEILKLKAFISKRKQTYKRKRKETGAPTRALSAYNIFIKERFKRLSRENEVALKSSDTDARLKRVPPASLVASTGNQWKELSAQEKQYYEEKAQADRKRYEEEMANYQAPEGKGGQGSRKRNKTGYNMFFSQHVIRLKQTESGVPSERGSVARLVGEAWKQLSAEEKQYYEREADMNNQENPVEGHNGEGGHHHAGGDRGSPASKRGRPPKSEKGQHGQHHGHGGHGHPDHHGGGGPPPQAGDPYKQDPNAYKQDPGAAAAAAQAAAQGQGYGAPPPYDAYGPPPPGQGGAAAQSQDPYAMYGGYYGQYGYGGPPPPQGTGQGGPPPPGGDPYGGYYGYSQHGYYPQEGGSSGV